MLEAPLFSATGDKASGSCPLPADYFDGAVNEPVLHQAVKTYLGNQRQGTAATKSRAKVSGGGAKPWRQKGTGRARQGTIRAPHWRGGGIAFGPSPRDYRAGIPAKVRKLARRSALNARAREGAFFVVDGLAFEQPKTSALVTLLGKIGVGGRKTLILTDGINRHLYLSARNIPGVNVMPYHEAAAYDVLWAELVVVERAAMGDPGETSAGDQTVKRAKPKRAAPAKSAASTAKAKKAVKKTATKAVKKTATKTAKKTVKKTAKKAAPKTQTTKDDD
jgi:large subunit ribosomal protein L4